MQESIEPPQPAPRMTANEVGLSENEKKVFKKAISAVVNVSKPPQPPQETQPVDFTVSELRNNPATKDMAMLFEDDDRV